MMWIWISPDVIKLLNELCGSLVQHSRHVSHLFMVDLFVTLLCLLWLSALSPSPYSPCTIHSLGCGLVTGERGLHGERVGGPGLLLRRLQPPHPGRHRGQHLLRGHALPQQVQQDQGAVLQVGSCTSLLPYYLTCCCRYLTALAVADLLFLAINLIYWWLAAAGHNMSRIYTRASNGGSRRLHNHGEGPRALSWLKGLL